MAEDDPNDRISEGARWALGIGGVLAAGFGLVFAYNGRVGVRNGPSWEDPGTAALIGGLFVLVGVLMAVVAAAGGATIGKRGRNLRDRPAEEVPAGDPSKLDDPLARAIAWDPVGEGVLGAVELRRVDENRLEYRVRVLAKLTCLGVGALGLCFLLVGGWVFGLALVGSGVFLFFYLRKQSIVFDKARGYFWKGSKDPEQARQANQAVASTPLGDIQALQLLAERWRGGFHYQLNLVRRDGTRSNLVISGRQSRVLEEAAILAEFLAVPVWNGIRTDG